MKVMSSRFEVEIASNINREDLVAEIFYDGEQWAQIYKVDEKLFVQFFACEQQPYWEFPIEEALLALGEAKKRLLLIG